MDDSFSRDLLGDFLEKEGIDFSWLPESDEKSADLELWLEGQKIIGELKTVAKRIQGKGIVGEELGDTVRDKIAKASPQLKNACKNMSPGILFLLGETRTDQKFLGYDHVVVAMQGAYTFCLPNFPDWGGAYEKHGKGNQMGKDGQGNAHNKSITAIAVCRCDYDGGVAEKISVCCVYHNKYASVPIESGFPRTGNAVEMSIVDFGKYPLPPKKYLPSHV